MVDSLSKSEYNQCFQWVKNLQVPPFLQKSTDSTKLPKHWEFDPSVKHKRMGGDRSKDHFSTKVYLGLGDDSLGELGQPVKADQNYVVIGSNQNERMSGKKGDGSNLLYGEVNKKHQSTNIVNSMKEDNINSDIRGELTVDVESVEPAIKEGVINENEKDIVVRDVIDITSDAQYQHNREQRLKYKNENLKSHSGIVSNDVSPNVRTALRPQTAILSDYKNNFRDPLDSEGSTDLSLVRLRKQLNDMKDQYKRSIQALSTVPEKVNGRHEYLQKYKENFVLPNSARMNDESGDSWRSMYASSFYKKNNNMSSHPLGDKDTERYKAMLGELRSRRQLARMYKRRSEDTHIWWASEEQKTSEEGDEEDEITYETGSSTTYRSDTSTTVTKT